MCVHEGIPSPIITQVIQFIHDIRNKKCLVASVPKTSSNETRHTKSGKLLCRLMPPKFDTNNPEEKGEGC